jgi:valyl-tRNA synthetase
MEQLPMYNPVEIEPKWQARWEADGLYHADINPSKKKYYVLTMLPYTSGGTRWDQRMRARVSNACRDTT